MQSKHEELEGLQQKVANMIGEEIRSREEADYRLARQIEEKAFAVK